MICNIVDALIYAHLVDPLGLIPRLIQAGHDDGIHSTPSAAAGETGVDDVDVVERDESDDQEECVEDVSLASGQLLPCLQDNWIIG